jgi:ABC-type antimicrobial peptide transport system permease subunit
MEAIVVALFGITSLLLTLIGVYAVVSHSVSRRRREIGIRIALGGQPGDIRRMLLRQGIIVVIAGLGIGLLAALAMSHVVSSQFFEVTTADPLTWAGVSVLVFAAGLMACYLPTRGATHTDAWVVLRAE